MSRRKGKEKNFLLQQCKNINFQASVIADQSTLYTYNYSLSSFKKASELQVSESFIFYLQLKALYPNSYIEKGYGKKIAKATGLSITSVSLKLAKLVNANFAIHIKNAYYLRSYKEVYSLLEIDDQDRKYNTIKIKSTTNLSKKQLKQRIEELEVVNYGCLLSTSALKGAALKQSPKLKFTIDYTSIGQWLGKSKTSGFKIMRRVLRKTKTLKTQNRIPVVPSSLQEALTIKTFGGKKFYSEKFGYMEQSANSYSFLFKQCRSPKYVFINKSICDVLQRKLYMTKSL